VTDRSEEEKDWELAQGLIESAVENSRAYTLEEAPWLLVPQDDPNQRKISTMITRAMTTKKFKVPNVKNLLGGGRTKK
jgi:hypothetical protein